MRIPLWLKIAYSLFVAVLVPIYWRNYGPVNFLWFSDTAVLALVAGLWLESRLLISMMALAVLLPHLGWDADFVARLLGWDCPLHATDYMFEATKPLYLRSLSLYHVFMPVMLIWLVRRLGYDRRALGAQTVLCWAVLTVTYGVSPRAENINWVFGPGRGAQTWVHPLVYLAALAAVFPVGIYLPTSWALRRIGRVLRSSAFRLLCGEAS